MGTTPNGLAYPELSNPANVPGYIQGLATSVDARYGLAVANWAALAAVASPFAGMQVWVTNIGTFAVYTGSAWLIANDLAVVKTVIEQVNNATLQDDDALFLTIPTAGTYIVEVWLLASTSANAAGDIKLGATFPSGTVYQMGASADQGLASGSVQPGEWKGNLGATSGATTSGYGLSTNVTTILQRWTVIASAAGTFRLQWAQVSASGSTSVHPGSHMTMKHVA